MKLSDKTYDILKWLVLIVIPALTTFSLGKYFSKKLLKVCKSHLCNQKESS